MGWTTQQEAEKLAIKQYPKFVAVYCHSSRWDAFICILYSFAFPEYSVYTLVKPQLFEKWYLRYLFRQINFIPATKLEDRNGGVVGNIVDMLRDKDNFIFLISPKGTVENTDKWRTGYYYIAKNLNVPIICMSTDYYFKRIVVGDPVSTEDDIETVETKLKNQLSKFHPLYSPGSSLLNWSLFITILYPIIHIFISDRRIMIILHLILSLYCCSNKKIFETIIFQMVTLILLLDENILLASFMYNYLLSHDDGNDHFISPVLYMYILWILFNFFHSISYMIL